jgi:hypothetical protein
MLLHHNGVHHVKGMTGFTGLKALLYSVGSYIQANILASQ